MKTSESILEILQQICDKFGIVIDENMISLSQLAENLRQQIAYRYLIGNGISLIIYFIIIGVLFHFFKNLNEQENFIDRSKVFISIFDNDKDSRYNKKKSNSNFKKEQYISEYITMCILLFVMFLFAPSIISNLIETIQVLVCPDTFVLDYFMKHYLNYSH